MMNKEQFCEILQTALLYFEGMPQEEILNLICKKHALIGIKLVEFLKNNIRSKDGK